MDWFVIELNNRRNIKMKQYNPILDLVLSQDCKVVRQSSTERKSVSSGLILEFLDGFLAKDGAGATATTKPDVTYGLRIAAEYGGNNGNVLDRVTELAQRYNSAISNRGSHINQIILFENNKHVGYHRIPKLEE